MNCSFGAPVIIVNVVSTCTQELDEPRCRDVKLPPPSTSPHCQFRDFATDSGGCVTVLLENPVGCRVVEEGREEEFVRRLFQK